MSHFYRLAPNYYIVIDRSLYFVQVLQVVHFFHFFSVVTYFSTLG